MIYFFVGLGSFSFGVLLVALYYFWKKYFRKKYLVISVGELVLGEGIPYSDYDYRINKAIEKWQTGNYREVIILTPEKAGHVHSAVDYIKLKLWQEDDLLLDRIKVFYESSDPPSYAIGRWEYVFDLPDLAKPFELEYVYMGELATEDPEETEVAMPMGA